MLVIINGFANIPWSSVKMGAINPAWLWAYFIVLSVVLWFTGNRKAVVQVLRRISVSLAKISKKWVVSPLLVVALLTTLLAFNMPDDKLHVSFLDVGQGDAILIQTPNHQDILVDGGPSAQAISGELSQHLPFCDRTIELVVLTHPHLDHLTGLLEVLQRYKVQQVLYLNTDYQTPPEQEWLTLIHDKGIKATLAEAGQVINLGMGATSIEVINPIPDSSVQAMDNGVVLRLSDGKVSFLLTSDISQEAELDLITRRADLSSTVLKVIITFPILPAARRFWRSLTRNWQ